MKLLLKREQTTGRVGQVNFKLWAKIEIDDDDRALVNRYKFDQALLMGEHDPSLLRKSGFYGLLVGLLAAFILDFIFPMNLALLLGLGAAGGFTYWYYNEKRDQVFVKDLMHGRHFKCPGIIDLTKKEAEISEITAIFRQVMESAKHWGGTETEDIPVLTRDEARELILKVF
ncbi:MAG: hypothetical protein HRT82_08740 [Henriciella sp.]|nr:hypothetical protein [Henriciella sp.]